MKRYQKIITIILILILSVLVYLFKDNKNIVIDKNISNEKISTTTDVVINDVNEFYEIHAIYPKEISDKNSVIEKKILEIVNRNKEEWKIGGDLYNELKTLKEEYSDYPDTKYELNISYNKYVSKTKGTVSYVFQSYKFTGGAHGNTALFTYTFNDKGFVNIDNFLNTGNRNGLYLTNIIKEKLTLSLGDLYNEEMLNNGLSEIYTNFDNFVVLDEGIKFIFEQYQVAPYAAGQPEVLLTWEELNKYLVK